MYTGFHQRIACGVQRWLDAEGKILTPGFLDQHVHITGGGGEGSFIRGHRNTDVRTGRELVSQQWWDFWVRDGITRSVDNLYAKTRVLCEEGVSAYMLTGAYGYPSRLSQVKQTGTSYS